VTIAAPFAVGVSPAAAAELPSGAELQVRLLAPVSSRHSRPGQAVAARLIAPVVAGGHTLLPAGSELRGEVRVAGVGPDHRAQLRLEFSVLVPGPGVDPLKIDGRVVSVDNARETVDAAGRIVGLPPPRLRPSKVEVLLLLAAHAHPVVLGLAEAGKLARRQAGPPAIAYGAGVEMTLRLLEAVRLPAEAAVAPAVGEDLAADVDLVRLASAPPFRAVAARLRAPCDLINIMFVGSGADLHAGFVQAGWSSAAAGARPTS